MGCPDYFLIDSLLYYIKEIEKTPSIQADTLLRGRVSITHNSPTVSYPSSFGTIIWSGYFTSANMSVSLSVFPSSRKNINPYLVLFSPAPLFNNGGGRLITKQIICDPEQVCLKCGSNLAQVWLQWFKCVSVLAQVLLKPDSSLAEVRLNLSTICYMSLMTIYTLPAMVSYWCVDLALQSK